MKCLSVILLAIAFSQGTKAETIPELIEEVTSIVQNRVAEVGQLIGNLGKNIGKTYGAIENNVKQATQNLTDEIGGIRDVVNTAAARAAESGKNIDECASGVESSVSALNLDVLKTCQAGQELTSAQKLIGQLARLPRQLGTLIPKCLVGIMKDVTQVRSCLDEGLQVVDDTITNVNSNILTLIDGALDTTNKCIDGVVSDVNTSVSNIAKGLDDCVNDLLNS